MQATRRGRMGDLYAAIATGNIAGPSGARDLAASLDPDARGSVRHDPGDLRAIEERLQARKEKLQVPEAAPDASRLSSPELSLKVVPTRRSRASRGAVPGPGPARPGADLRAHIRQWGACARLRRCDVHAAASASRGPPCGCTTAAGVAMPIRSLRPWTGATPPMDALVMAWAGAGFHNPAPALGGGRSRSIDPWREGHRASPASRSALGV